MAHSPNSVALSRSQALVLSTSSKQGSRCWLAQATASAHVGKRVHLILTIALSPQVGIRRALVQRATGQVSNPSLNRARRNKDVDTLRCGWLLNTSICAFGVQGVHALDNTDVVAIDQHDQHARHVGSSKACQFPGECFPHELLTRTAGALRLHDSYVTGLSARLREEAARKGFVLVVFAKDDESRTATHCSQPRAISSDSFSGPRKRCSCGALTAIPPDALRCSSRPLSPPK